MKEQYETLEDRLLNKILEKMCSYVGADYKTIDRKYQWYLKYEWTKEQEDDFKQWLVKELSNESLFTYLTGHYRYHVKTKKFKERIADSFISNYGWKTKKEDILQQQEEKINIR